MEMKELGLVKKIPRLAVIQRQRRQYAQ